MKAKYTCGQLEQGENGTIHIQFFANFGKSVRMAAIKKFWNKLHCEPVVINNGADDYCMKDDTRIDGPWTFGERPVKRNSKHDWEKIYNAAKNNDFDQIPA